MMVSNLFAVTDFDKEVSRWDTLYKSGNYQQVIKEIVPVITTLETVGAGGSYTNITDDNFIHAKNLMADSYRMLGKYTKAAISYDRTSEGFFDGYASYSLEIFQRISIVRGRELKIENLGYFKLFDDVSEIERKKYFEDTLTLNADKQNSGIEIYKYLAGRIPLESLLQSLLKDDIIKAKTFAGINLEVNGNLEKARELYTQVLSQNSDRIEALLAANRLGLIALKMSYVPVEYKGKVLNNVIAYKTSSAKLENTRLYSVKNLIDDDPSTTWVPVGKNSQIGQWAELGFDDPVQINSLTLTNGFAKNDVTYNNNNRIKIATLVFSDGSKTKITLKDTMKPQIIKVNKKSRTVKLIIDEVYKGVKYDDTCLSGLDIDFKSTNK